MIEDEHDQEDANTRENRMGRVRRLWDDVPRVGNRAALKDTKPRQAA